MILVYIVQGVSAVTPGAVMSAHKTHDSALHGAASLVNILLGEAGMRRNATPANFAKRLCALQLKKEWEESADVWITETELKE